MRGADCSALHRDRTTTIQGVHRAFQPLYLFFSLDGTQQFNWTGMVYSLFSAIFFHNDSRGFQIDIWGIVILCG